MGYKFNPLSGKLDIVGTTQAELSEEIMLREGQMFDPHGAMQPTDFAKNNMAVKDILQTILCKPTDAEVVASGAKNFLTGTTQSLTATFAVTKKSYDIVSVAITGGDNDVYATENQLAKLNNGETINFNSLKSNVTANTELQCKVVQQNADDIIKKVAAKFYYPYLIFTLSNTAVSGFNTVKLYYNNNAFKIIAFENVSGGSVSVVGDAAKFQTPIFPTLGSTSLKSQNIINNLQYSRIGMLTKGDKFLAAAPTGTTGGQWPSLQPINVKLTFSNKDYAEYVDGDFIDYGHDWYFYYTNVDANTQSQDPNKSGVKYDITFKA